MARTIEKAGEHLVGSATCGISDDREQQRVESTTGEISEGRDQRRAGSAAEKERAGPLLFLYHTLLVACQLLSILPCSTRAWNRLYHSVLKCLSCALILLIQVLNLKYLPIF